MKNRVGIGLMGLGVVGGGVAKALQEKGEAIARQAGSLLELRAVLEQDLPKSRLLKNPELMTQDPQVVLGHPDIDIVIEVLGGENPAWEYIKEALTQGKHVITANKEVMAKHGLELLTWAAEHEVALLYEASVGGGIPLISPLKQDLLANDISAIQAIINGTTNYILTRMSKDGLDFAMALRQAQELGYAEANPANDIEGIDAAYKLSILATLAFHAEVRPEDVHYEGISRLAPRDFQYAKELGYAIKLLAIAKKEDYSVQARVHPTFVPEDALLAEVDGVFNAVQIEGDLVGKVIFYGEGAGPSPTSSAIVADAIRLAQNINRGVSPSFRLWLDPNTVVRPVSEITTRYYLRMTIADRPGVLAQIAKTLGEHLISISSVIQKGTDETANSAEIVLMTHPAKEAAMQQALTEMQGLEVVKEISNFVRVEG